MIGVADRIRQLFGRTAAPAIDPAWDRRPAPAAPGPAASAEFYAIVQSSTAINSDPTTLWKYSVLRVLKKLTSGHGADAWETVGDPIDAYNDCEVPNDQTGTQGNGVALDELDFDADDEPDGALRPVQPGVIVRCRHVPVDDPDPGEPVYETWFTAVPNGLTVTCS